MNRHQIISIESYFKFFVLLLDNSSLFIGLDRQSVLESFKDVKMSSSVIISQLCCVQHFRLCCFKRQKFMQIWWSSIHCLLSLRELIGRLESFVGDDCGSKTLKQPQWALEEEARF